MCKLLHTKNANRWSFILKDIFSGGSKTNRHVSKTVPKKAGAFFCVLQESASKKERNLLLHSRRTSVFTTEHRWLVQQESTSSMVSGSVEHTKLHLLLLSWAGRCSYGGLALQLQHEAACRPCSPFQWWGNTAPLGPSTETFKGEAADSLVAFAAALSLWGRSGEQLSALAKDITAPFSLQDIWIMLLPKVQIRSKTFMVAQRHPPFPPSSRLAIRP